MRWVSAAWGALLYAILLCALAYATKIPLTTSSAVNKGVAVCFVLLGIHDAWSSEWTPLPAVWAAVVSHWLMNTATPLSIDLQGTQGSAGALSPANTSSTSHTP